MVLVSARANVQMWRLKSRKISGSQATLFERFAPPRRGLAGEAFSPRSLPDAHLFFRPAYSVRHALHGHAILANDGAAGLEAIVMLLHAGYIR